MTRRGPLVDLRWALVVTLLLGGCASFHQTTADDVHQQWIAAIQANDQATILRLVAPEARMNVGSAPDRIYADTVDPHLLLNYKPTGPFSHVDVKPVTMAGVARVGLSIWHYRHATKCYDTTITKFPDGWKVISLYNNFDQCPKQ